MLQLTAVFEQVESGWWQARVKELPEVITAAPTQEEAFDALQDAVNEYVASMVADGRPIPVRAERADQFELAMA